MTTSISERGTVTVESLREQPLAAGTEKLTITDYHRALLAVVAFGEPGASRAIATMPEDEYRIESACMAGRYALCIYVPW